MKTAPILTESRAEERRQNLRAVFRKGLSGVPNRGSDQLSPVVSVQGYQYLVNFGEKEDPRYHRVSKGKTCSCGAPFSEAIDAVRQYLQAGDIRAPEPDNSAFMIPYIYFGDASSKIQGPALNLLQWVLELTGLASLESVLDNSWNFAGLKIAISCILLKLLPIPHQMSSGKACTKPFRCQGGDSFYQYEDGRTAVYSLGERICS